MGTCLTSKSLPMSFVPIIFLFTARRTDNGCLCSTQLGNRPASVFQIMIKSNYSFSRLTSTYHTQIKKKNHTVSTPHHTQQQEEPKIRIIARVNYLIHNLNHFMRHIIEALGEIFFNLKSSLFFSTLTAHTEYIGSCFNR